MTATNMCSNFGGKWTGPPFKPLEYKLHTCVYRVTTLSHWSTSYTCVYRVTALSHWSKYKVHMSIV